MLKEQLTKVAIDTDSWRGGCFITGGNSAVMIGGRVRSDSPNGCPRRLLLRNESIETPFDTSTLDMFAQGYKWEDVFKKRLESKGSVFEADKKFKIDLDEGVNWTLSTDFYVTQPITCIIETKCCVKRQRVLDTFVHGKYKIQHLLQLICYMVATETPLGFLSYGSAIDYKYNRKGVKVEVKALEDVYSFKVEQKGNTFVITDTQKGSSELSIINKRHVISWLNYIKWVLQEKVYDALPPDPFGEYIEVCKYCPFQEVCTDLPDTYEEFLSQCREVVSNLQVKFDQERLEGVQVTDVNIETE
jgi:CRISPR/Cas system-associated exonuclease Cas4 (RecB family)